MNGAYGDTYPEFAAEAAHEDDRNQPEAELLQLEQDFQDEQ